MQQQTIFSLDALSLLKAQCELRLYTGGLLPAHSPFARSILSPISCSTSQPPLFKSAPSPPPPPPTAAIPPFKMADLIHPTSPHNFLAWRGDENTPQLLLVFGVAAVTLSMIINLAASAQTKSSLAAWLQAKPEPFSSVLPSPGSALWVLPPPPVTIVATVTVSCWEGRGWQ